MNLISRTLSRAAVKAVETVDECAAKIVDKILSLDGTVIITADHGNADCMVDEDGGPFTAHTTNKVPFVVLGKDVKLHEGRLADIAPTMLQILGIDQPAEMTGKSLID